MNNFNKLKKKNSLGTPPLPEETKNNLQRPEDYELVDGRSLKRTGRTHQLSTRVTDVFYKRVKMIAARDGLKIVELLEVGIDMYEKYNSREKDL